MADMSGWQIVLVDDEPDSLDLIYEFLIHKGVNVLRASDGQECMALLAKVTPTAIVADLAMPKLDGWGVLSEIRANPAMAALPVIAITAYHSANVEENAMAAGFDAYFAKPVNTDELMATLAQLAG